ncbi:MAG TPA: hypothetical protein VMX18_00935 [Candidatus Bipolaricaulota bacterium]|nr:hypothetical protein [Candidatus Bipolaricaulota bacterium]
MPSPKVTNGLLILLIVLLIVLLSGLGLLFYYLKSQNDARSLEDWLENENEIANEIEAEVINEPVAEEATAEAMIEEEIDYYNSEYGFGLTLPAEWKEYNLVEKNTSWQVGSAPSFYFGLPAQKDGLFAITIFTHDQWDIQKDAEGPKPVYITENSQHIFTWDRAQSTANAEMEKRMDEVPGIIATFVIDAK